MARILIGNIKGPKGDTGARGATGPQGPEGPQGPLPPLTNNALATVPGVSALDAVMGKTLQDQLTKVNSDFANKTSDTGWKAILGESGIDAGNLTVPSTGYTVKYRRKNGVVYIQGTIGITGKNGGENLLLFTLPVGYRPSQGLYSVCTSTGYVISRYIIQTNGNISLEWVRRLSDGTELTGDIIWVGIDISFPVT